MDSNFLFAASLLSCQILGALAAVSAAALVLGKSVRELYHRYAARRETHFLGPIMQHLLADSDTPPVLPRTRPLDSRILEGLLLSMSATLNARDLKRVQYLFQTEGFAFEEARRLASSRLWWIRARAAQRLGQMRAASGTYALVKALEDPEIEVKLMAAWSLGQVGELESLRPIFGSLAGYSKIAALRVANIVVGFGPAAAPILLQILSTSEPVVQALAIRMLGELGDRSAARPLSNFLHSENKELRIAACEALARIGEPLAALPLRGLLQTDGEWAVVAKAAQALGTLKDPQAIPLLVERLGDRQWWVRLHAGEALARLGERGRRALEQTCAGSPDRFARDMAGQWLDELQNRPAEAAA